MKKGPAIGIGVAVIAVTIFVGIASIPDEVLLENPNIETSENQLTVQEPITEEPITEEPITEEPITEEPITEEPITEEPITEEPITEETIEEPEEESTDSKTIQVEIRDGVGSADR
jgi:hypothetical protein